MKDAGNSSLEQDLYRDNTPTALHAAVQLGDMIRRHTHETPAGSSTSTSTSLLQTPGLADGLIAGLLTAALLTPVRGQILNAIGPKAMGIFPDLVVTSVQAVAAATSALYVGSLQGSRVYLQQLARIPAHESSGIADAVCGSDLGKRLVQEYKGGQVVVDTVTRDYYFSQDPRRQALESFAAALQTCRRRTEDTMTY